MNVDWIREFCLAFPHATENLQWGDNLCFKIGGKIFVMLGLDDPRICFKCTLDRVAELVEREDIRPAPYVGRYKWVMLDRLDALPNDELKELIGQSYKMVSAKTTKLKTTKLKTMKLKRGKPGSAKRKRPSRRKQRRSGS